MLSFDDGTAGQAHEGLAQLTRRGMTATFFVMTVVLGKSRWMSTRDSTGWPETLRKASGQSVQHFAYPYGAISTKAFPHLSKAGYKTAFQLQAKKLDRAAPLYTLRRSLVVSTWNGAMLLQHLTREHP